MMSETVKPVIFLIIGILIGIIFVEMIMNNSNENNITNNTSFVSPYTSTTSSGEVTTTTKRTLNPHIQVSTAIVYSDGSINIYLTNKGSGADTLIKIILNSGTNTINVIPNRTVIPGNFEGWISGTPSAILTLSPGQSVTLKLYFEISGTITVPVTVVPGSGGISTTEDSATGTPSIVITTVSVLTNGTVWLYVVNDGTGSDRLLEVELNDGITIISLTSSMTIIDAGFRGWIRADPIDALELEPGRSVTVKLYFEKSGVITVPSVVQG